jgi:hypothetical protein
MVAGTPSHLSDCSGLTEVEAFRAAADLIGDHPGVGEWRGTTQIGRFTAAEISGYRRGQVTLRRDIAVRTCGVHFARLGDGRLHDPSTDSGMVVP